MSQVRTLIGILIAEVIGVTFISPIQTAIADANLTGTIATLANLIPTIYIIGLVVIPIALIASGRLRGGQ